MDKLSVPTDNIFKFYALFGLVLFIFSIGALIYQLRTGTDQTLKLWMEVAELESKPNLTHGEQAKLGALKGSQDVDKYLAVAASLGLGFLIALSAFLIAFGFYAWHKHVQPLQDALLVLQREKLQLEVDALKRAAATAPPNTLSGPTQP